MNIKRKQYGFTLVELMVGLVIGLLISGIVITTFMQSKRNYSQDERIARLQENGRFALQLLSHEISMAGFAGNMQLVDKIDVNSPLSKTAICGIDWWEIVAMPITVLSDSSTLDCISGEKSGTNIVIFRRVEGNPTLSPTSGKLYFRTNGRGGEIHVSDGTATPTNYTDWPYLVHVYYIKGSNTAPDGLYRKSLIYSGGSLSMTAEENLVPGFFDIGSVAGLDTVGDGVADRYVSSVTTTPGMVGLKIDVLMSSETKDHIYTNGKTYNLGLRTGITDLLDSNYYGRVFSTTIPLRNTAFRNRIENIGN
jgi:type IV pilus assembly protein PilW